MTAWKGFIPKGAALSAEENLWFEKKARAELARLPTRAWQDMLALWNWLPLAHPATRRRILADCLRLTAKRGDPLSMKIAEHVIHVLAVSGDPKAGIHDERAMRAAARHLAHNPQASLSELAAAAGLDDKKTTIRQWKTRPDFKAYLNDEEAFVRGQEWFARLDSERREHEQRGRSVRRPKKRSPKKVLLNG
jgi:hypothetical protein